MSWIFVYPCGTLGRVLTFHIKGHWFEIRCQPDTWLWIPPRVSGWPGKSSRVRCTDPRYFFHRYIFVFRRHKFQNFWLPVSRRRTFPQRRCPSHLRETADTTSSTRWLHQPSSKLRGLNYWRVEHGGVRGAGVNVEEEGVMLEISNGFTVEMKSPWSDKKLLSNVDCQKFIWSLLLHLIMQEE